MCTNVYPCENERNKNDGYLPNQEVEEVKTTHE